MRKPDILDQKIIALAIEGRTLTEIAFMFDLTFAQVLKVLLKNNINTNFQEPYYKVSPSPYKKRHASRRKAKLRPKLKAKLNVEHIPVKRKFSKRNRRPKYSNKDLLKQLKELAEQIGRTPTNKDLDEAGKASRTLYSIRFGSLTNAQRAAGLIPNKGNGHPKYTNEYLLNYLKELAEKLGRTPTSHDLTEAGEMNITTFRNHFGNLSDAQKAAGLIPNSIGHRHLKYSDEYLLNFLKELSEQLGRIPFQKDLKTSDKIRLSTYNRRFGSFYKALLAAGLAPNKGSRQRKYSMEYLLNHLIKLSKRLERTPSQKDIDAAGKVRAATYRDYFGSFSKAQKAAGLVPNKSCGKKKYSEEYLLNYLKKLSEQLGRTPSGKDLDDDGKVCAATYRDYFGSFINAQKAAELIPNKAFGNKKYSDKFLLNHLKELSKQLERTPSQKDIDAAGKVRSTTYRDYFGSFVNAQKAAGLVPNKTGGKKKYTNEYLLNYLKKLSERLGKTPSGKDLEDDGKLCTATYRDYFGSFIKAQKAAGLVPNK